MKAAVCTKYGPPEVVQIKEVPKPTPRDKEVLIRIVATSVTSGDCRIRGFNVPAGFGLFMRLGFGITKPRNPVLGSEFAGEIEAVGSDVTRFSVGDQVFGSAGMGMGVHAEYKCASEKGALAIKPANMTYEEAAVVPFGGTTALYFLRDKGNIQKGQKVLVNGASGSVGTAGVQLAKYFGADVTGVCSSANAELVKSLGADRVIDYAQEDFTQNGEMYDLILDTVGNASFSRCKNSLQSQGKLLAVVGGLPQMIGGMWISMTNSRKVVSTVTPERAEDLVFLRELIEAGQFKAVIDKRYPLEQIAEAHRHVDTGHKKGNVVVTVAE